MRTIFIIAATAALGAACAPDSDKSNPAIATEEATAERVSEAPAAGASSFTEGQARDRITASGFTDVSTLMKADDGTWRGSAMMNGQSQSVVVDYQGNVTGAATAPGGLSTSSDPTAPTQPATPVQPTP